MLLMISIRFFGLDLWIVKFLGVYVGLFIVLFDFWYFFWGLYIVILYDLGNSFVELVYIVLYFFELI